MENKGTKKKGGIPESWRGTSISSAKHHQGRRSPSTEIPQVHFMSGPGSRTPKYEERRRSPAPAPPPVWAPSPAPPPVWAPVIMNRHRSMPPAQPSTIQTTFPVHKGGQQHLYKAPPPVWAPSPAPVTMTRQATFPVEAKGKTAAYGTSSSTNRTHGMVGTVEVCESCNCSFYPNVSGNSRDAFLFGDKYCTACLLAFQRK